MNMQWGSLMQLARRAVNLTQEDFASDFGKSRASVWQWESGRKPMPQHMKRAILDILSGYYNNRAEIKNIETVVNDFLGFSSVHFQGHRGLLRNKKFISDWNEKIGVEFRNANILSHLPSDCLVHQVAEQYTLKMLEGKSDIAQLIVFDRSALVENYYVKREITPISAGVGTVLLVRETPFHMSQSLSPELGATAITRDGTEETLFLGCGCAPNRAGAGK